MQQQAQMAREHTAFSLCEQAPQEFHHIIIDLVMRGEKARALQIIQAATKLEGRFNA
ncbi:hypothetical protein [Pseudomonas sp. p1(2021b)]|uniref:hypothetical protein n=1 Tax=Pseudomonas sp. p1(2021b) TaxID=2874628 RepID=UPI003D2C2554